MTDLHTFFDDLVRVEILLWEAVDGRLRRELDLPLGRIQALRAVAGTRGCRVQDIADALALTVGAASKLVDRLEAADLCTRRANPGDRRSSIVEVTVTGHNVLTRAEATISAELASRLSTVPRADIDRFAEVLARARRELARS